MRLHTFDEVLRELEKLEAGNTSPSGSWTLAQLLSHCAQSVEYSIAGYPKLKPALFRATVGRLVKKRFLSKGEMSHDLEAPVPGAPELQAKEPLRDVAQRLRAAIAKFRAHEGALAPHLAYGECTREEYEKLHAMHIANHLSRMG